MVAVKARKMRLVMAAGAVAAVAWLAASQLSTFGQATTQGGGEQCPLVVGLGSEVRAEVTNVFFTDEVQGSTGNRMKLNDEQKAKVRLAVVTVKITKPIGKRLTLAAADLTLHYYHGAQTEVAPCEGISTFSTSDDADRPMELSRSAGPGFVKQTTGAKSTAAGVVFIDAIFGYMEPDTGDVWICIGQPGHARPFRSKGWKQ